MRTKTEENYLKVLVDLYFMLNCTNRISINSYCGKSRVSKGLPSVMQEMGIIKCLKKGRNSEWIWVSSPPDINMVKNVLKKLREKSGYVKQNVKPKIQNKPNEQSKQLKIQYNQLKTKCDVTNKKANKNINISLFWGLFTFIKK